MSERETYFCPKCGSKMDYVGGLLEWECPNCGAMGSEEYDMANQRYYLKIAKDYSLDEIYSNPYENIPECCKSCGGPYPSCLTSCKIFDD